MNAMSCSDDPGLNEGLDTTEVFWYPRNLGGTWKSTASNGQRLPIAGRGQATGDARQDVLVHLVGRRITCPLHWVEVSPPVTRHEQGDAGPSLVRLVSIL